MKQYIQSELLGDKRKCDVCTRKTKWETQILFHRFPPYLILQLKRFTHHGAYGRKVHTALSFPITDFDVNDFLFVRKQKDEDRTESLYDLYAIVSHVGNSIDSGHYVAYCKHPTQVRERRQHHSDDESPNLEEADADDVPMWYKYNDAEVHAMDIDEIVKETSCNAYILFYAAKTTQKYKSDNVDSRKDLAAQQRTSVGPLQGSHSLHHRPTY